jgi:hypothetical protein
MLSMFLKGKFVQRKILCISIANDKVCPTKKFEMMPKFLPRIIKNREIFLAITQKSFTVKVFFFV